MRHFPRIGAITQEKVVVISVLCLFVAFAIGLQGFFSASNLIGLVRNVSVLGVLGVGMAIVIIGRGIDLSVVSILAITVAFFIELLNQSMPFPLALGCALSVVILIGCVNGFLIAYADIPPIFATLATGLFVYGFGRSQLVSQDVSYIPAEQTALTAVGSMQLYTIPLEVFVFIGSAIVAGFFLRYTKIGSYTYFMGDNFLAARNLGIPVRPMIILQYVVSSLYAFLAGLIIAANLLSMNTRIVNSTLLYDIILVVVIGGIGLSGGKGGIRNVIFGTLLVGIIVNGMTIMDLQDIHQKLIKAVILLFAIVADAILNPRDEQIDKQGDI